MAGRSQTTPEPWQAAFSDRDIVVRTSEGYTTEGYVKGHRVMIDEPLELGGNNTGPTPNDYLATALASCTSITLRMYANRKEWPVNSITVKVRSEQNKSADGGRHTRYFRTINLEGDVSPEQQKRLLGIANRCPVHQTLEGQIEVETELSVS